MENLKKVFFAILVITLLMVTVNCQISTPCTVSMIASFTPCMNFITGSIGSGSSPTSGCCDAVRKLMSTSMDCTCLIITGSVPFAIPSNLGLALSLPSICQSDGLPIQCKASGVPLPPPGPVLFGPTLPPTANSPFSPRGSKEVAAAPTFIDSTPAAAPAAIQADDPTVISEAPTTTPGIRPVLTPASSSNQSYVSSLSILLLLVLFSVIV